MSHYMFLVMMWINFIHIRSFGFECSRDAMINFVTDNRPRILKGYATGEKANSVAKSILEESRHETTCS